MNRSFLRSCSVLVLISVLFCALPHFGNTAETASIEELVQNVVFRFSVVDYQFSFTVENHTNLDIVSFRVYDYQQMNDTLKGGTESMRRYPVAANAVSVVPAGITESITPTKMIWRDCNNIVVYVYDIVFSDGSEWGTQYPVVSEIPNWALKFEVPFTFSETFSMNEKAERFESLDLSVNSSDAIQGFVFLIVIIGVIVLVSVLKKKRSAVKYNHYNNRRVSEELLFDKGQLGEYLSYEKLDQIPGEKRLLHNLYIPKRDGTTTEIDCLLIHQNGLFVIESKNYKGYIWGSPNDKNWTQVLRKNKHFTFYNPVLQNQTHINHLKSYLSYPTQDRYRHIPAYSIIAFGPRADITKVSQEGLPQNTKVINVDRLFETIISIVFSQSAQTLSAEDITRIYEVLLPLTNVTAAEKQRHIDAIRS